MKKSLLVSRSFNKCTVPSWIKTSICLLPLEKISSFGRKVVKIFNFSKSPVTFCTSYRLRKRNARWIILSSQTIVQNSPKLCMIRKENSIWSRLVILDEYLMFSILEDIPCAWHRASCYLYSRPLAWHVAYISWFNSTEVRFLRIGILSSSFLWIFLQAR